jgi:hypothetical protein
MRELHRPFSASWFSQVAVATLLALLQLSNAIGSEVPDFSGVWVETQPNSGPPMQLQVTQSGSRVQVRISYGDSFSDRNFGVGTVENGAAIWTIREGCVARFRWPGYNYDNPGLSTFTLSLRHPAEPGEPGPLLVYVQEIHWNVPCASNHRIGTERVQKILRRR